MSPHVLNTIGLLPILFWYITGRSLYIRGMEHQATRTEILAILEDLDPAEVPTMVRAVRVMLEAGWMSETEALKWWHLIHALPNCSPGVG